MYTGMTVLGEFSELQYSLSPSYQATRLLVDFKNNTGQEKITPVKTFFL